MLDHLCSIAQSSKAPDFRRGWLHVWHGSQQQISAHAQTEGPIILSEAQPNGDSDVDTSPKHHTGESVLWAARWCRLKANILYFYMTDEPSEQPLSCAIVEGSSVAMLDSETARSAWGAHMPKYPHLTPAADDMLLYATIDEFAQQQRTNERDRLLGAKYVLRLLLAEQIAQQQSADNHSAVYLACASKASATQWRLALRQCTVHYMQDRAQQAEKDIADTSSPALTNKLVNLEKERQENSVYTLRCQVEALTEANTRLRSAAEITEKAASETTEQQIFRVETAKIRIAELESELSDTMKRLEGSLDRFDVLSRDYRRQQFRCAEVEDTLRRIREDWEETKDNPARIVQSLQRYRDDNQELLLENKRIKREVEGSVERFQQLESIYGSKLKRLKEIMEASEVFKFLQIRLLLALHRAKYIESCYNVSEEESAALRDRLVALQKASKMAETSARSEYVKHRSLILAEQMQLLSSSKSIDYDLGDSELKASRILRNAPAQSEYFAIAKITLDRLGWLLNETRSADLVDGFEQPNLMAHTENEWLRGAFGSTMYTPSDVVGMELMDLPEPYVPLTVHMEAKLTVQRLQAHLRSQERLLRQQSDQQEP